MGTPDFSVPILQDLINSEYEIVLVVTQPDRPRGRRRELTPPPIKVLAAKEEIDVFQPENLTEDYEKIFEYKPDLIITAAYGQLLPNALLDYPSYGCINVHASLLPELRGGAPIHHAIIQGKTETGITIMYMVEKLDAGDILTQKKVPIEETDDVGLLHNKLSAAGANLLLETLPRLFKQEITPIKQDDSKATFAANITRKEEKIDWAKNDKQIYNHIRGLRPWPVAYTTKNNNLMKIWHAELDNNSYDGKPGEIAKIIDNEAFVVICGNNQGLRITEIQPAGRTKMKVSEYLHGSADRIKVGSLLGDTNE